MDALRKEAESFAHSYSALFASSDASSAEHIGELARKIGQYYRPGMTMFTNGKIARFEVRQ
jgi:hypothetical protein